MRLSLVDTHCHLQLPVFDHDREAIIRRAKRRGVARMIVPGVDSTSSKDAIALAKDYPGTIFAAAGIHPYAVISATAIDSIVSKLESLVSRESVVAIGEIGLDYHRYRSNELRHRQRELFTKQLEVAQKLMLPVIIHCRDAWGDLLTILSEIKPRGVVHCFSGGRLHLLKILELGLYLGIDGNITYNKVLPTVVREAPLKRVLIETDSPYLTPVPFRGMRNEPAHVATVAEVLAKIFSTTKETIACDTTRNAMDLFDAIR